MKTIATLQDAVDVLREGIVQQEADRYLPQMNVTFWCWRNVDCHAEYGQAHSGEYFYYLVDADPYYGVLEQQLFDTLEAQAAHLYELREDYNRAVLQAAHQARTERHHA